MYTKILWSIRVSQVGWDNFTASFQFRKIMIKKIYEPIMELFCFV